jgi:uncharacterized protein (DUF697 family)
MKRWPWHRDEAPEMPASSGDLDAVVRECRRMVSRRSLVAASAAAVPVPGIDWVSDVAVLMKLIPDINRAFGLTPEQVARLAPERQIAVYKAISAGGGLLVGKLVTRDVLLTVLKTVGVRLTTSQATKFVPIAGQAVAVALTYSALRFVCEQHIQQCRAVSRKLLLLEAPSVADEIAAKPPRPWFRPSR